MPNIPGVCCWESFTLMKNAPPSFPLLPLLSSPLLPPYPSSPTLLPPLPPQIPAGRRTEGAHLSHQLSHRVWISDWGTRTQDWTAEETTQGQYNLHNVCVVENIHSLRRLWVPVVGHGCSPVVDTGYSNQEPRVQLLVTAAFFFYFPPFSSYSIKICLYFQLSQDV